MSFCTYCHRILLLFWTLQTQKCRYGKPLTFPCDTLMWHRLGRVHDHSLGLLQAAKTGVLHQGSPEVDSQEPDFPLVCFRIPSLGATSAAKTGRRGWKDTGGALFFAFPGVGKKESSTCLPCLWDGSSLLLCLWLRSLYRY